MSWQKVKLGQFLKNREGRYKPNDIAIQGLKRIDKINFSGTIFLSDKPSNTDMILVKKGDLVISGINVEKGAMNIYQGEEDVVATIHYSSYEFDEDKIDIDFLTNFLKSLEFKKALKEQVPGGIKTEIKPKHILPLIVEIPTDIKEQKRIVKKLIENNSIIEDVNSELTHQLDLIKQMRQAFLREAMQGKLCHAELVSASQETGNELLAKIKAEKAQLIADKKLKKEKELLPIIADEIPFEIPEHWAWCRIDKLVSSLNKDIRTGPFGTALQKNEHKKEGIPVWGIESISKDGKFTNINKIYVSDEKAKELKSFEVKGLDLIISRSGTIGELCMLPFDVEYGLISTNLMKISVNQKVIMPEYFCHIIKGGGYITKMLQEFCSGSTRLFITQKILSKLIFPLPPLHEQEQIVAKLEELMAFCDGLEQSIKESQGYNEKLLQQVLREALLGNE